MHSVSVCVCVRAHTPAVSIHYPKRMRTCLTGDGLDRRPRGRRAAAAD